MVSLIAYKKQIELASDKPHNPPSCEHVSLFIDYLFLNGFTGFDTIVYNQLTRISDATDKAGKQSGWYIYYQNESISVGVFGSWKKPEEKLVWYSRDENTLTMVERAQVNTQIKEAQEKQKRAREEQNNEAAQRAVERLTSLPDATPDNPYLKRKRVGVFAGVKADGDNLIIPVTMNGAVTSTQTIQPDGSKRFLMGGKVKGCYFILEGDDKTVYIAEGYATGASIAQATGNMVYIAFSSGNLYETAAAAKTRHVKVVVCGDNDDSCYKKAAQITEGLGITVIFPPKEYNDFNDWMVDDSRGGFLQYFASLHSEKQERTQKVETAPLHTYEITGVIRDIVNYYNATAKREQPLFAVQAAIATCSIILARNFETNNENRTSLFLMNVAKSGTGKEHAKKVVEKILEATGNGYLISGDGYTSQSAVISACQERPRHITIIDEFSKYLQASQNKQSGGHIAEANATLMQAIGRLEGKLRAKARATIGMTGAAKKELQNQYVVNPAITLLSMTTPEDFFNTIGIDAIKDGFINRFIICISDAKRCMPSEREPMEVPESIISWVEAIGLRRGTSAETPVLEPPIIKVEFSSECDAVKESFHRYCMDMANANEKFGLAEISSRSAEMAYRLALIIALSDNPNAETIEANHMQQAVNWVKFNLDRLVKELKSSVSSSKHEAAKKEILKALRLTEGVSKSDMFKRPPFSKYERKILNEILSELQEAELVTEEVEEKEGAGRRRTVWKAV